MSENGNDQLKINGTDSNVEPTELDPCVVNGKPKRKFDIFHSYRDEISARSGLSRRGVYVVGGIVIFTIILSIIVVALACTWPRIPHRYQFPVCDKPECLRAAAQIREGLNTSVSPCDDLWASTCGGWLQKYPLPRDKSIWNQKQQLVRREAEQVRDLIATLKLPLLSSSVEGKMKRLYESCMDVDNIKSDGDVPLTNIINELGGWYILRNWNEGDFDKNYILQKLHVDYRVSPFFKISVGPNPNVPDHNAIRISPSGLGLPDKGYYYTDEHSEVQSAYQEYISDVVMYLDTARVEATKFGMDIFSYEKRIAEVTPDTISLQNPITTYNVVSLSELKETILIPFFDIIQAMYTESNITENTEVVVTSLEYLGEVAQIMATTDRKTMNGYLMWTLVRNYIPYLSNTFTSLLDTYNTKVFGIEQPQERWEMCAKLTNKFMALAIDTYLEKINPITKDSVAIVNNIFNSIVAVVKDEINKFEKTALLYDHLKSKISTVKLQIGVPANVKSASFLKDYYVKLQIYKTNLFKSVRSSIDFHKSVEEKNLGKSPIDETILSYALSDLPTVRYSTSDHTVVVPRSLLSEPLFEENYPSSIVYARLGVEIAEAIVSSVLPYDSLWTSDRKILSPFHMTVNESFESVRSNTKCLADYIRKSNLVISQATINETALKVIIHLAAVNVANKALLSSLEKTRHTHQPSLETYEDSALFFVAYSQTQCSVSTKQQQFYESTIDFQLPHQSRLHLAWTILPEFSRSLECSIDKDSKCSTVF